MALEHAFVSAVLRYVTLVHAQGVPATAELEGLEAVLTMPGAPSDGSDGGAWERRRYRRLEVDMPAAARDAEVQAPARVVDIGAGGLRLRNDGRLRMRTGDRLVVSLFPDQWPVRIDLPVEVVRIAEREDVGVRFCGRPLVLHRRLTPGEHAPSGHGTAEMGAVG